MSAPLTGPADPGGRAPRAASMLIAAFLVLLLIAAAFLLAGRLPLPGGSYPPEMPTGPDQLTGRMRTVRDTVAVQLPVKYGIGCHREDSDIGGGEHPLGRACDFMISSGGRMPTPEHARRGEEIAAWAQSNAREYGIWYVIYRQQIWSTRWPGRGWRPMEDRGGLTQNHFDHVHISVW